jgi:chromate transporter
MASTTSRPETVPFREALQVWLKIGLLSFGGPAGQIALMHRILVEEKRWIGETRFLHALNYCMLLPGPEAQQLATYAGWLLHRTAGGLVAGLLFILPGFLVILGLSMAYMTFHQTAWLETVFFGLKAAVLAIVIQALLRLGSRALKTRAMAGFAAFAFAALFLFDLPFPAVIAAAGLGGYALARWRPALLSPADDQQSHDAEKDTRHPTGWGRSIRLILVWAIVWASLPLVMIAVFGWDSVYGPIAVFFSKMAVVTFGGAYAVLSYVAQEAVETLGWLRPGEMLDGLALAETTPGPLILVLTYVGFIAGFREAAGLDPLLGGFLGALLATWVTFAPCFLWIFLGAPHVERLASNRSLSLALAAITAAVVGVILNLAIWFALHVLFETVQMMQWGPFAMDVPVLRSVDPAALLVACGALIAMLRFRVGLLTVLAGSAAAGAALRAVL